MYREFIPSLTESRSQASMARMSKPKILIQFDTDEKASVFDAVVAVDSGVDHLLQYSGVRPEDVRGLVHGAMFTRGPADLRSTAIFIGGSNVSDGESIASVARETLSDPFRVSIMLDSNGANSTAAAAVLSAAKHVPLANSRAVVLAATGAVGQRVCRMLANANSHVSIVSRSMSRSEECIERLVASGLPASHFAAIDSTQRDAYQSALSNATLLFGCGAAGVQLLNASQLQSLTQLRAAIDLNAVSPCGIEGIGLMDKGIQRGDRFDYGALGVGGLKMKIHKACIAAMFESNNHFFDCQEMLVVGQRILDSQK
jgi:methylenetetrahydrofolate/methylenetetrahydromethanopterin dehydrogenase (NADP+)